MSFTSDSERATAGHVETQPPLHAERTAPRGVNVAIYLAKMAEAMPAATAVVEPRDYDRQGKRRYRTVTFRELDDDSSRIAGGLSALGVRQGTRLALLVPPGIDFVTLVFALFKVGAVTILIDPGMGRMSLLRCLAEADPEGFIAIPFAHAVRSGARPFP